MSRDAFEIEVKQPETSTQLDQDVTLKVPEDVSSISIEMKTENPVWLTYMVYDEQNELRAQFMKVNAPQPLIIHQDKEKSSPYTIHGPIHSGKWTINVGIIAKENIEAYSNWCTCTITFNDESIQKETEDKLFWQDSDHSAFDLSGFDSHQVFNTNKKWYKGDFHTHTIYTDGDMTREENMVSAANQELDFFVATDHNLVPTSWFDQTDILVIPGVEVTSSLGHFNILNTNTSPFLRNRMRDMFTEKGMNRILTDNYGEAVISINHPFLTEWKWLLKDTPLDKVDTIEIWNDPTYPYNPQATEWALLAWNYLLNDGYSITGIGGSDSHLKPEAKYEGSTKPSLIGDPGTFVYCNELTAANVVKGLKAGNVIVSREAFIDFQIDHVMPGDHYDQASGIAKANVDTDESIYMEWVIDGQVVKKDPSNVSTYKFDFIDQNSYHWIRVDVRYEDGSLYGFTNPIYFGHKQPTLKNWGQLLELMEDHVV